MRFRFALPSSPALRQLLGGVGGALVALAVYGVAQLLPASPSLHASAPENRAASQSQMLDQIAATTRRLLEEQGVPLAEASADARNIVAGSIR